MRQYAFYRQYSRENFSSFALRIFREEFRPSGRESALVKALFHNSIHAAGIISNVWLALL